MKRLLIVLLISICFVASVYAGIYPDAIEKKESISIKFTYDNVTMQKCIFGFTDKSEVSMFDISDEYDNVFSLNTAYVKDRITYGYGDINFYWKLKTTNVMSVYLYLDGPLRDSKDGAKLDWSISFVPVINGIKSFDASKTEGYGSDHAVEIFSTNSFSDGLVGTIPVHVETVHSDSSLSGAKDHDYIGHIGIMVKDN